MFAKESSHIKLATFFGADAITWTQVAGPEGSKLNASVLYPRDPKRRLEVLWNLDASRSDTQLIVINGQSTWIAPNGIKLGMPIAAIEKTQQEAVQPEGIRRRERRFRHQLGRRRAGDAAGRLQGQHPVRARSESTGPGRTPICSATRKFQSSNPALRTVGPKVTEIILGY